MQGNMALSSQILPIDEFDFDHAGDSVPKVVPRHGSFCQCQLG